jgi:hypothetical protein
VPVVVGARRALPDQQLEVVSEPTTAPMPSRELAPQPPGATFDAR